MFSSKKYGHNKFSFLLFRQEAWGSVVVKALRY
jgi:hypothetical protein